MYLLICLSFFLYLFLLPKFNLFLTSKHFLDGRFAGQDLPGSAWVQLHAANDIVCSASLQKLVSGSGQSVPATSNDIASGSSPLPGGTGFVNSSAEVTSTAQVAKESVASCPSPVEISSEAAACNPSSAVDEVDAPVGDDKDVFPESPLGMPGSEKSSASPVSLTNSLPSSTTTNEVLSVSVASSSPSAACSTTVGCCTPAVCVTSTTSSDDNAATNPVSALLQRDVQTHGEVTPPSSCAAACATNCNTSNSSPGSALAAGGSEKDSRSKPSSPDVPTQLDPVAAAEVASSPVASATASPSTQDVPMAERTGQLNALSPPKVCTQAKPTRLDVPPRREWSVSSSLPSSPLNEHSVTALEQEAASGLMDLVASGGLSSVMQPTSQSPAQEVAEPADAPVPSKGSAVSHAASTTSGARLSEKLREQSAWSFSDSDGLSVGDLYERVCGCLSWNHGYV